MGKLVGLGELAAYAASDRSEELLGNCESWERLLSLAVAMACASVAFGRQAGGRFRQGGALLAVLQARGNEPAQGHRDLTELVRLLRPARRGLPLDMAHQASIWEAALARTALRHCSIRQCHVGPCQGLFDGERPSNAKAQS